jgi:4-alpha-glucanotransferase
MTDRDGYEPPKEGVEAGQPTEGLHERADLGSSV